MYTISKTTDTKLEGAIASANSIISDTKNRSLVSNDTVSAMVGFESLRPNDTSRIEVASTFETLTASFKQDSEFSAFVEASISSTLDPEERAELAERGYQVAASTVMLNADTKTYLAHHNAENIRTEAGDIVLGQPGLATVGMEAFVNADFNSFLSESIVNNVISAISQDAGVELFFPTSILPAGEVAVLKEISHPYIYDKVTRNTDGTAMSQTKTALHKAITDRTVLANDLIRLYPNGGIDRDADNAPFLVDKTVYANKQVNVEGRTIETRPLKAGVQFEDLITLSSRHWKTDTLDETDVLEPNIRLEEAAVRFSFDNGSTTDVVAVSIPVKVAGAQFTKSHTAKDSNTLNINTTLTLTISSKMGDYNGALVGAGADLGVILGGTAGDDYSVTFVADVSGRANHETAQGVVNFNNVSVVGFTLGDEKIIKGHANFAAALAKVTIDADGFVLKAYGSLANSRTIGRIVDNGTTRRYIYPLTAQSPWASKAPSSNDIKGGAASLETLSQINSHASAGRALDAMMELESNKDYYNDMSAETAADSYPAATLGVKPLVITDNLDLADHIAVEKSSETFDDVRALINDALTVIGDRLVIESGYCAALRTKAPSERAFDYIVLTGWRVSGMLMRSGDPRTLGQDRNLVIATSLDKDIGDKCYLSVRRKSSSGTLDELSFGGRIMKASMVARLNNHQYQGSTSDVISVQAIDEAYVTCPLLAILTIENLDKYHKRS